MRRFLVASVAALALLATAREARANGRFPESNQLVFSKSDPNFVLVRVTFGLLVSHDKGKTFDWVCEQSIGYTGVEDPMYTVTPSGRTIGSTFQGITASADQGCNWSIVGTAQPYIDLASNPNDPKNIVALSTVYKGADPQGNVHFSSSIAESTDEGATFKDIGPELDDTILGHTLDLTASDPNRIYVTAVRYNGAVNKGLLFTSKDRGKTWKEQEIPLVGTERSLFIAAVDPNDAEKVYIRTNNQPDAPGRLILRDKNPLASDAGTGSDDGVLKTLFTGKAPLEGFALTADGKKMWIGSPLDGVWSASTADFQFTQKSQVAVKCLALNDDGLWACSDEKNGFIAGISKDEGATFTSAVNFCTIRGPLACTTGSTTEMYCPAIWPAQRDTLGCNGNPIGQPSSSGVPDASFADAGGGFPATPPSSSSGSSCDCQSVIPSSEWSTAGGTFACVIGAAAALLRRRRR